MTGSQLLGPRYQRLIHGIHRRRTQEESIDLATWSQAAALLIGDRGALAGYSAAELSGASCAPRRYQPKWVVPGTGFRPDHD